MDVFQLAVFELLHETAPAWANIETQTEGIKLPFASVFIDRTGPYPPDFFLELSGDQLIVCNQQFTAQIALSIADPDLPEKVWAVMKADFRLSVLSTAGIITPARVAYERRTK